MKKYKMYNTMKIVKYIIPCLFFLISCFALQAQERKDMPYTVSGTVKSAYTKQPLPGISITLPGVSSAMTGDDGLYTIKLPSTDVILKVSGPGYSGKEISVRGRSTIDIEIYEEEFSSVNQSMIVPKGESSPLKVTNAWTSVNEENILSTATTADALLQGRVAGLNVVYRSGSPGNGANIFLRGFNTMHAGSQPLYVVDGMPYENSAYSSSRIGNYFSNPLASIDIKDIESITVMKDGTSLYGVKGGNGVVLIRTIKAKEMETKINFHMHTGINFEPKNTPVLNASESRVLFSDILQSSGMSSSQIGGLPYMDKSIPQKEIWGYSGNADYYRYNHNTNWQDQLYDASFNQNYYLNVFGGDETALYALSIGFLDQQGAMKSTSFQRFNTRFNSEIKLTSKFTATANMSFVYGSRDLVDEGPFRATNPIFAALVKAPFTTVNKYNEDGRRSPDIEGVDVFGNTNPYSLVNSSDRESTQYRFIGNIDGEYKLTDDLKLNAMIGVNFNKEREKIFYPGGVVAFDTLALGVVNNKMEHRVDRLFSLYGEGSASYDLSVGTDHDFGFKLGMRYQHNESEDDWGTAFNSSSDNFKSINYGEALLNKVGGFIGNWNWASIFGNVNYGFKSKYFLTGTLSADASSRYGDDVSTFLYYPSISGAWLLTGEDFLKSVDALDVLKLRVGYSLSGNDDIGNYNGRKYYKTKNLQGIFGLVPGNLVDLNLKPEKLSRFNVGVDASFLNERVNVSLDVYQSKTTDMITQTTAPRTSGFQYYVTNGGALKNTGVDLTVNSRILNGLFKWDLGFTVSAYKNEITDLKGEEYITSVCGGEVLSREGEALGVFYGYKTNGVYSTQQDADDAGLAIMQGQNRVAFGAGDVRFIDSYDDNGNGIIDEKDRVIIGDPNPDMFGSISNSFSYKRWNLDVFMTYSLGNDVYNYTRSQLENMSGLDNQTKAVRNRWRVEGDVTDMPRATYGDPMGNARFSDRWIEDGSYLKVKTISLGYKLPINYKVLRSCTFFMTAENLITFTGYKGQDPEFSLGTNPLYYGIDASFVPHPKTLSLGFKLEL
ncbi:SusC/RagA family TonB-linked outer membrane protein [Dysgonomonas sp. 216]|uniref:SusC/RagA family TonB-linked outer membrane protein n=1 Tax=Dysgonomonas sp. 216 TaxID=2302934 RepID=UPI001C874C03|nr:SusC/RagA family TonB-linked outer membrane protein [Dysgonomonas sp. 216]NDW19120.1 SusC/RagA family TonB-linked outer membrane protein [Dysgonomonas sp. 216]